MQGRVGWEPGRSRPVAFKKRSPNLTFKGVSAMQIRKEATYDGVWTVFVGRGLCISDLSAEEAEALIEAFSRIAAQPR
ncbi:hypothetical protein [Methylobacterium soli]|uniref:hypothetical protein n=1 Tax=Methylobacterium soli TaxID=553447 RepID=UPI001EE352B3|nr:hypothetical protein [Methylobacterium soli]